MACASTSASSFPQLAPGVGVCTASAASVVLAKTAPKSCSRRSATVPVDGSYWTLRRMRVGMGLHRGGRAGGALDEVRERADDQGPIANHCLREIPEGVHA